MMRHSFILAVLITLMGSCLTIDTQAQQPLRGDPFATYLNSLPGKTKPISITNEGAITVRKITFPSGQGRNTIYGILAAPAAPGKYPALLVFHGGSSCAEEVSGIVRRYAGLGYVAMAIDLPGICDPKKTPYSDGPWKSRPRTRDLRFDISQSVDSSTLVDAVTAALQAFNLLGSLDNVDKQRIGLTGFSWGGYTTTILAGLLGPRVKAAYSVFGCGFYDKGSNWKDTLAAMPAGLQNAWLRYFDAGRRAAGMQAPYFIEASSNDKFFWPAAVMSTLDAVHSTSNLVWGPNLDHTRLAGGDEMQQLYFDYYLKGQGLPFGKLKIRQVLRTADGGKKIQTDVDLPKGVTADSVLLYYAEKDLPRLAKTWKPVPMSLLSGKTWQIDLPAAIVQKNVEFFVYVSDSRRVKLSTYIQSEDLLGTLKLPALVADNMVLQRNSPIPVWGWASPGAIVTVVFRGKTYTAETGRDGKWLLRLDKQKAGGPYDMRISGDGSSVTIKNILIGDVWLCSGQSNMAYSFNEPRARKYYAAEIEHSKNDQIRQLLVPRTTSAVPLTDFKTTGWLAADSANLSSFSIVAWFFARRLFEKKHIPIGLINSSYGGTMTEAWTSEKALRPFPQFRDDITFLRDSAAASGSKASAPSAAPNPRGLRAQDYPTALYNAMIAPLVPYAIKGVIWYQGENNAGRAYDYRSLFPNMISDWREQWQQNNFPFIYQQLTNWRKTVDTPSRSDWAELREAQTMTLSVSPNTAMAVGIELGESDNIHPVDKKDIGDRLFRAALPLAYHEHLAGDEGPFYKSMKIQDGKILLTFDTRGSRLVTKGGEELHYFAVAGADKKFVWARAVIKDRHTVEVGSDQVMAPVAVRYAWADNPEGCNLYNAEGLPASPFRTDDWPGITKGKGAILKRQFLSAAGDTLRYRILYPENYDPQKKYPLVLFLHGSGERGADNERQLQVGGIGNLFMKDEYRKNIPCIVLFPQCPADQYWATVDIDSKTTPYTFHFNYQQEMKPVMRSVMELTQKTIKEDAVDTNRIYIMGLSMGAIGTYEIVYRFPELFAGAVAVCGAGDSSAYTSCTSKVPFFIFHGDADPVVGVNESKAMYQRLTELKGDVHITIYPGIGHTSWRNAFESPDLLPDLFGKVRQTHCPL